MITRKLLKQIAGSELLFAPEARMGFTNGGNYVTIRVQNYNSNTHVELLFNERKPNNEGQSQYSRSIQIQIQDIPAKESDSVNAAISEYVVSYVVDHLKSFNKEVEFEQEDI